MNAFIKKNTYYIEDNKIIKQAKLDIIDGLHQLSNVSELNIILSAYILYKIKKYGYKFEMSYQDFLHNKMNIDQDILDFIKNNFSEIYWEYLKKISYSYSPDILFNLILLPIDEVGVDYNSYDTPESIIKLSEKILNLKVNDLVGDLCCGNGNFLLYSFTKEPNAKYIGFDINKEKKIICSIRAELIEGNICVYTDNVFDIPYINHEKFDKIFANYPFGVKFNNTNLSQEYINNLENKYPNISKTTFSDWIFNALLLDLLKPNGKAIGIMTNGSCCNSSDALARQYFIENGFIEAVISLPPKMFNFTNISTSLVIFSYGNKSVRLVDATNICNVGRRQNNFSEDNIEEILSLLVNNSNYSKEISLEEMRDNDYFLNISRYIDKNIKFNNVVKFESIAKKITRGATFTANQLDKMISNTETNIRYLMLSNIQDGIIDDNLPFLTSLQSKYMKYCLKNNNLIIAKNGYPYKIAIANVDCDEIILASGNLYIIELDETKANPYYIKAFLESEYGENALKNITVGTSINSISIENLKNLSIPLPDIEEQSRISIKYKSKLNEIMNIKLKLNNKMNELKSIFNEEILRIK